MSRPFPPERIDVCPHCGQGESEVRDSRPVPGYPTRRRRRRYCSGCNERWTTIELPEWEVMTADQMLRQLDDLMDAISDLREKVKRLPDRADAI